MTYTNNDMGPDGRVTWHREDDDMGPICNHCFEDDHTICDQRGANAVVCYCSCETAHQARRMIRDPETVGKRLEALRDKAHDLSGVQDPADFHTAQTGGAYGLWLEDRVVAALVDEISALRRWQRVRIESDQYATVKSEGAKESADPMLLRAKAALEEIRSFERVEVEHVQDITEVTNALGEVVQRFDSGAIAVEIAVRGYLR